MSNYLENLTARLAAGLAQTPVDFRARHRDYLLSVQNSDGGFSGREGGSDLYYTSFGLRGLACLGSLRGDACDRAAVFLRSRLLQPAAVVDFMALLYSARLVHAAGGPDVLSEHSGEWPARVAAALESFRKPDGGYGKATEGAAGSTYHTFLVALCYELIGLALPDPDRVVNFVRTRRRDDGGFVEVAPARRGGTNPTAAAVAILNMQGAMDAATSDAVKDFLVAMQSDDGGLRANDRVPVADLLSTFTAYLSLSDLAADDRVDREALHHFVTSCDAPSGGFHAGFWDEAADVEYTFYGLGTTALLGGAR
jgi:geranylgeranyl transferase type-2 subunit beta